VKKTGQPSDVTLIFDGDCSFCTSTTNFVLKQFKKVNRPLTATPWQFADLASFGLTESQVAEKVYLIEDGQKYAGHECFARLLRLHGNPLYRFASWLMLTAPIAPISAACYSWVAKNRHKMPGGTPACAMPQPPKAN
jgi:predicted DCC family thiol-disulfide oxidoreductase YuxK